MTCHSYPFESFPLPPPVVIVSVIYHCSYPFITLPETIHMKFSPTNIENLPRVFIVAADIVVVLDASKSMGQVNFRIALQIVKIIFTATGISRRGVKAGFIIVGKRGRVVFNFRQCRNVVYMSRRVGKVQSN
jgi:hypothetical protein